MWKPLAPRLQEIGSGVVNLDLGQPETPPGAQEIALTAGRNKQLAPQAVLVLGHKCNASTTCYYVRYLP